MTTLIGKVASTTGDLADPVTISATGIALGALATDPWVPDFLTASGARSCPAYLTTVQAVLDDAQTAARSIVQDRGSATPCIWLAYFAPFQVQGYLSPFNPFPVDQVAYWRLAAKYKHPGAFHQNDPPAPDCFDWTTPYREFQYKGARPAIGVPLNPLTFCDLKPTQCFKASDGTELHAPASDLEFLPGSGSILLLSMAETYDDPELVSVTTGEFMPIPEIPSGFPPIATAPPFVLTGGAVMDVLTDDDCSDIVVRGGGFQNITDIANQYQDNPEVLKVDYHTRTETPYPLTLDELKAMLLSLNVDFWVTVDLPTTTGGAPLTLTAMINAYSGAIDSVKTDWQHRHVYDFVMLQILQGMPFGDEGQPFRQRFIDMLNDLINKPHIFHPVVEIDYTVPNSGVTFSIDTDGAIKMVIKIGGSQMANNNEVSTFLARYCTEDQFVKMPVTVALDGLGRTVTDADYKKIVLDLLYELRECCNPCPEFTPSPQPVNFYHGDQTSYPGAAVSISDDIPGIYRVTFTVLENNFPKVVYFGSPPLMLLAKFAWRDASGRYGEIQYINLDHTTLVVPSPDIVGFMCHCYTGVALSAAVRLKYEATRPSTIAPPPPPP